MLPCDDVPESLRAASCVPDQMSDDHTEWRIVRADNRDRMQRLQARIGRPFPSSFLDQVLRSRQQADSYACEAQSHCCRCLHPLAKGSTFGNTV